MEFDAEAEIYIAESVLAAGPDASVLPIYNWRAEKFIGQLPAIMSSTYRKTVVNIRSGALRSDAASSTDLVNEMMRSAVQHVVQGLKAHLHYKEAVRTCLKEFSNILRTLQGFSSPLGILAGPTMWTMLGVLLAYPRDEKVAIRVLRQICLIFDIRRHDEDGLVLLSDAMRPRAIAIIDAFVDNFDTSQRHMDLHNVAHSLREWIEDGTQLGI